MDNWQSENTTHENLYQLETGSKELSPEAIFDNAFKSIDLHTPEFQDFNLSTKISDDQPMFEIEKKLQDTSLNDNLNSLETSSFEFDYSKLQSNQYISFKDYDIQNILSYLISLPDRYQHDTTVPAAVIFQCSRYIDLELKNSNFLDSFIDLVCQKIKSSIQPPNSHKKDSSKTRNEKSTNNKPKPVDLVRKSYWLGSINLLYFYFYKEQNTWFYKKNPKVLQKIVDLLKFLIIQVCTSIYENFTDELIEEVLLNYSSIEQLQETTYKGSWNFFNKKKTQIKSKSKVGGKEKLPLSTTISSKKSAAIDNNDETGLQNEDDDINLSSYEAILKTLYPPSLEEQFRSPLKICQIFSALIYCLDLHSIHKLFQQQCLALSIKWFTTLLFNKILKNKSKTLCTRAKAIQIRLNLTMIQDWVASNNITLKKPTDTIDLYMWEKFPDTLVLDECISNVLHVQSNTETNDVKTIIKDENNALFYYQPLTKISSYYFAKVFELLEWLQVMTSLKDEDSLKSTLALLENLSIFQILRTIEKYRYEIDEPEFKMKKYLKTLIQKQTKACGNSKDVNKDIYIPERTFPNGVVLPTMVELIPTYNTSRDFVPVLALEVQDQIETIHDNNEALHTSAITQHDPQLYADENLSESENESSEVASKHTPVSAEKVGVHQTNVFDELTAPSQALSRGPVSDTNAIGEIEQNPW